MNQLIEIKNKYYRGEITIQEAKKLLFNYASHRDAIVINNKSLAVWEDAKKYWNEKGLKVPYSG